MAGFQSTPFNLRAVLLRRPEDETGTAGVSDPGGVGPDPTSAPPAAPAQSPADMGGLYQTLLARYGLGSNPAQDINAALQGDQDIRDKANLAKTGEVMLAAMQRRAPNVSQYEPEPFNLKNLMLRRQLASEDLQREQQLRMFPLQVRKEMAGIGETESKIPVNQAEAALKGVQAMSEQQKNTPIPPETLAQFQKSGLNVPPGTTWARLSDFAGPIQKGQEIGIQGKRYNLELQSWLGNHPARVSPLAAFKDPTSAYNDKAQSEASDHRDLEAALTTADHLLAQYQNVLERRDVNTWTGKDVGQLKALHSQLMAAGLKALGTNKFGQAPMDLVKELAPEAYGLDVEHVKDWAGGKAKLGAQLAQARESWKANLIANAGAHNLDVSPAVLRTPGLSDAARASGVQLPAVGEPRTAGRGQGASEPDPAVIAHFKQQLQPGERLAIGPNGAAKALAPNDPVPAGFRVVR